MDYRKIFWKLGLAKHLHRKRIEEIINEAGLYYGQLPILDALEELGTASQKEVANKLHVSAASMTNSVKRMERNGHLTCVVNEDDRRSHRLCMTEQGKKTRAFCASKFCEMDCAVMEDISKEDLAVFEKVLDAMIKKLEELEKNNEK